MINVAQSSLVLGLVLLLLFNTNMLSHNDVLRGERKQVRRGEVDRKQSHIESIKQLKELVHNLIQGQS